MQTPAQVKLAGMLLLAAMGVSLMMTLYNMFRYYRYASYGFTVTGQSLFFAVLWGVLVACIWKGQNWARIGAAVLLGYSVLMLLFGFSRMLSFGRYGSTAIMTSSAISLAFAAVRGYAVFLLFQPEPNAFFNRK